MAKYVLIESRDPFETNGVAFCRDLATRLAGQGDDVTLFLVQNGVLPARVGAKSEGLSALAAAGIKVVADSFSLTERGIPVAALASGIRPAPLDIVVDVMAAGGKVLWH
jgi:sulfur relay (sulfurtransferase) complex TusBCD TusD component (DsrE family)